MEMNNLQVFFGFGLFATVGLGGCADSLGETDYQVSFLGGTDDGYYISPALAATSEQFFGAPGAPGPVGVFVDIDGDTLSTGSTTRFEKKRTGRIGVSATLSRPISDRLHLIGGVSLTGGESQYFLPDGAGILVDPITIGFRHQTLSAELGAAFKLAETSYGVTRISGGVGQQYSRVQTSVTSALLNVQNTSLVSDQFTFVGIESQFRKPDMASTITLNTRLKKSTSSEYVLLSTVVFGY